MTKRVLMLLSLLAACTGEAREATDTPALAPPATAPAEPAAPEPTAEQVPIRDDFADEAAQAITADSYKVELATIAKELEQDEAAQLK